MREARGNSDLSKARMSIYLQSWVESSKDLPAELVRCFKLMQELDQRSYALQQSVDAAAAEQLEKVSILLTKHMLRLSSRLLLLLTAVTCYSCPGFHSPQATKAAKKQPGEPAHKRLKQANDTSSGAGAPLELDEKIEADMKEVCRPTAPLQALHRTGPLGISQAFAGQRCSTNRCRFSGSAMRK